MNRNRLAACAVVVAAVIAGWWWLHRRGAPDRAAAATGSSAPAGPARRERPERGGEASVPARVMIDDDPEGSLRLEGQVIDADDHGVAGATVVLAANPPRTATTEADGGFAFDGLIGRPYILIARGARGTAGPVTTRLTKKSDPVVLRLRPAGKLTVTVVGTTGKPIEGATVELRGLDTRRATVTDHNRSSGANGAPASLVGGNPVAMTDHNRSSGGNGAPASLVGGTPAGIPGMTAVFSPVVPGGYQIAAWADGMAHAFLWIQIRSGDAEAKLPLASGAPVHGRVVDDRGAGIAGARVRYSGASDWSQQASDRLDGAVTASDGSFQFEALPAGSFRFHASHPERAPGTSPLVTLDGKTLHDGVVIELAVGAIVKGHVVDRQHQPVASARVRIGPAGGARAGQLEAPRQAYSDAQGEFEIKGLPRKPLSAIALHETGSSQLVAVDATGGDVAALTLTIDVTGTIAGRVVDPQGQPVEGAQVSAGPVFGAGRATGDPAQGPAQLRIRGFPEDTTDASGHFQLTGLAAGQYRISAAPARVGFRGRGRGGTRDGVTAATGDTSVELVLEPDGSVRGAVAFSDGSVPELFSVGVAQNQQSFAGGDGKFLLDGLAPGSYELVVRGPSFQTQATQVTIEASNTADAGTITVVKGRTIAGIVVADGQPVPDATVYAGRTVFGNGTSSSTGLGQLGPAGAGIAGATKTTTTDAGGAFSLSGFNDSDLTVVAEQDAIGRSRALRLPSVMPGQTELSISLEKFGALSGTLRQGGKPADGVLVTCQSTSTPGAVYTVPAGPDGAYRFDRLAPDVYKVSAMLGNPRSGLHFYSNQIEVPPGREVTLDLTVDAGTVTLDVAVTAAGGTGAGFAWLATGAITTRTAGELSLRLAAAGPGASQRVGIRPGAPAVFTSVAPGAYSVCVAPYPREVQGAAVFTYFANHGDTLPTFCKAVAVAASPDTQSTEVAVVLPAVISDPGPGSGGPGSGGGRGSGSAH